MSHQETPVVLLTTSSFLIFVSLMISYRFGLTVIFTKKASQMIALTLHTPSDKTYLKCGVTILANKRRQNTYFYLILADSFFSGFQVISSIYSIYIIKSSFFGTSATLHSLICFIAFGVRCLGSGATTQGPCILDC